MKKKLLRWLLPCLMLFCLAIGGAATFYRMLFAPNVYPEKAPVCLYVHTGSSFDDLLHQLDTSDALVHLRSFQAVARWRKLPGHLKPGRYLLPAACDNYTLTSRLRSGAQDAVRLKFNNLHTLPDVAGRISRQLEMDSADLLRYLTDDSTLARYGLRPETAICLFIPNTYECWWNTSVPEFVQRMHREYLRFWNESRLRKAEALSLSPQEVMTLASIVEEENFRPDEQPRIAGLYINRLQKDMPLQSDPTVKFALGDFGRKRLLFRDLEIESPYNTYRHTGLPPGPIRMPSIAAIDAVLNYEHHPYLYMCAKEDFSGYHRFTASAAEHARNAQRYHAALNQHQISR
ncbi:MAG: endolytic transglycosylase MltG [Bacteroidales bacterium]|nr:endolytic transglycosylase MltG [Bacteroidales bacterium]